MISRIRNFLGRLRGFGGCYRCGDTWDWKHTHDTSFGDGRGCFPLCEECWSALTPSERLVYYDRLVHRWIEGARVEDAVRYASDHELIREAVMAGG